MPVPNSVIFIGVSRSQYLSMDPELSVQRATVATMLARPDNPAWDGLGYHYAAGIWNNSEFDLRFHWGFGLRGSTAYVQIDYDAAVDFDDD